MIPLYADGYQVFPNEILSLIIHQCAGDRRSLRTLSFINKFCSTESQPFLFQTIRSSRASQHDSFMRTLTAKPHLARYVETYDSSRVEHMDPATWTSLIRMLGRMDNLKHLSLQMVGYTPPELHTLDSLDQDHPVHKFKFKLRSLGLRRSYIRPSQFLREERWWLALIRLQAPTLVKLDLLDIDERSQEDIVQDLAYPSIEVIVGNWKLFQSVISRKKGGIRIIDITSNIRPNMYLTPDIRTQLSRLQGFSSRWVGRNKGTATCLLDCVECLSSVKYLGIAQDLISTPYRLSNLLDTLPVSGCESLEAITFLYDAQWQTWRYASIDLEQFIFVFKTCPKLRFIDIELPPKAQTGRTEVDSRRIRGQSKYCRIEARRPGQLYQYKYMAFNCETVFRVSYAYREARSFYFE